MSDINCIPDKKGVPMCGADAEYGVRCKCFDSGECEESQCFTGTDDDDIICYPAMVRIVAVAEKVLDWYDSPVNNQSGRTLTDAMNELREALSHE